MLMAVQWAANLHVAADVQVLNMPRDGAGRRHLTQTTDAPACDGQHTVSLTTLSQYLEGIELPLIPADPPLRVPVPGVAGVAILSLSDFSCGQIHGECVVIDVPDGSDDDVTVIQGQLTGIGASCSGNYKVEQTLLGMATVELSSGEVTVGVEGSVMMAVDLGKTAGIPSSLSMDPDSQCHMDLDINFDGSGGLGANALGLLLTAVTSVFKSTLESHIHEALCPPAAQAIDSVDAEFERFVREPIALFERVISVFQQ